MVPVGEGNGEPKLASCSGMLILRGCIFLLGGDGTLAGGGSKSSTRDWNWILMFVLGNLSVHLLGQSQGGGVRKTLFRMEKSQTYLYLYTKSHIMKFLLGSLHVVGVRWWKEDGVIGWRFTGQQTPLNHKTKKNDLITVSENALRCVRSWKPYHTSAGIPSGKEAEWKCCSFIDEWLS